MRKQSNGRYECLTDWIPMSTNWWFYNLPSLRKVMLNQYIRYFDWWLTKIRLSFFDFLLTNILHCRHHGYHDQRAERRETSVLRRHRTENRPFRWTSIDFVITIVINVEDSLLSSLGEFIDSICVSGVQQSNSQIRRRQSIEDAETVELLFRSDWTTRILSSDTETENIHSNVHFINRSSFLSVLETWIFHGWNRSLWAHLEYVQTRHEIESHSIRVWWRNYSSSGKANRLRNGRWWHTRCIHSRNVHALVGRANGTTESQAKD